MENGGGQTCACASTASIDGWQAPVGASWPCANCATRWWTECGLRERCIFRQEQNSKSATRRVKAGPQQPRQAAPAFASTTPTHPAADTPLSTLRTQYAVQHEIQRKPYIVKAHCYPRIKRTILDCLRSHEISVINVLHQLWTPMLNDQSSCSYLFSHRQWSLRCMRTLLVTRNNLVLETMPSNSWPAPIRPRPLTVFVDREDLHL